MFKITWRKHQKQHDYILGHVTELPDHHCHFLIGRLGNGKFHVSLPSRGIDNHTKRLIFRDANIARDFCEDFLNHNITTIVSYQISELQRTNREFLKSIAYYQNFLVQHKTEIDKMKLPALVQV